MADTAGSAPVSAAAREAYMRGLTCFGKEQYGDAIAAYDEALGSAPDWSDPLHAKGMALMKWGKLEESLEVLLRLTELVPSDPLAFTSLSMIYVRMERIEPAEEAQAKARMLAWQEEVRTNPNAPKPDLGPPPGAQPAT